MVRAAWLALALMTLPGAVLAQAVRVHGVLVDGGTRAPLGQVRVRLTNPADTADVRTAISAEDGSFTFIGPGVRTWRFEATRLGYAPLHRDVVVSARGLELGTLAMASAAIRLRGTEVHSSPPPSTQKADTTEFDARAVRTHVDADAGDLLEKMPGMSVQNGTVKTNGETVQQVLVDGKPFFGQDPMVAMRSLPADVIERIQVFDKLSDQAEFTGFDDGQSTKTINFILRPERRVGQFGKAYAGPGSDQRYLGGGSGNVFRKNTRLSVIGLANNVNQQNFSQQDLLGVLNTGGQRGGGPFGGGGLNGRRGGGGGFGGPGGQGGGGFGGGGGGGRGEGGGGAGNFLVGQQSGLSTTSSVGTNYSSTWGKSLAVTQSVFYNGADNRDVQNLARDYAVPLAGVSAYTQGTTTRNQNGNTRYDGRFEETVSPTTSVIDEPRLYFQTNRSDTRQAGTNVAATADVLSSAASSTSGHTTGNNLSDHVVARHRFARRGRTISLDVGLSYALKDGTSDLETTDLYTTVSPVQRDTLLRHTALRTTTAGATGRLVYTEPVGTVGMLQFNWSPRWSRSDANNHATLPDSLTGAFTVQDPTQSNLFVSTSTAQSAGVGFLMRTPKTNLMSNLSWESSELAEQRTAPMLATVDRHFGGLLPGFMFNWNVRPDRNLRVSLFTATRAPSITQVQDVVDVSNPLALTTGNPGLRESYVQTLTCRFATTHATTGQGWFVMASAQHTNDAIANRTVTALADSTLAAGTRMAAGSTLTYPVNLDGSWTVNTFSTWSRPVADRKVVLNLNGGLTWTRTPGLVGMLENMADTRALTAGTVASSNISEKLDFTLSYTGTWNDTHNSLAAGSDSRYYQHSAGLKLNAVVWRAISVRNEVAQTWSTGLGPGYDQNVVLWNASVGQKFLKAQRGELRLSASDLLRENRSVNRTVTSAYVQDSESQTLRPYVMLLFTYTLK